MRTGVTAVVSLLVAAIFSYAKLRYHCRIPDAEACVWGKAYFPVTLPLETLIFGAIVFAAIIFLRRLRKPRDRGGSSV